MLSAVMPSRWRTWLASDAALSSARLASTRLPSSVRGESTSVVVNSLWLSIRWADEPNEASA